jgi:hypothetical protein
VGVGVFVGPGLAGDVAQVVRRRDRDNRTKISFFMGISP